MTLADITLLNRLTDTDPLEYDVLCPMHGIIYQNAFGFSAGTICHDHNLKFHPRALTQSLNASNYW